MPVSTHVDRTMPAQRQRRGNALGVFFSFRAWKHIAAAIGMLGFDTVEQDSIQKDGTVRLSPTVSVRNGYRKRRAARPAFALEAKPDLCGARLRRAGTGRRDIAV